MPDTIISRCVSLQFRQPSLFALRNIIASVAEKEGYTLTDQSAALIALMADGSFRDALTLIQKVLFVSDAGEVAHDRVEEVLGAPRHQMVNEYLEALADKDVAKGVAALKHVSESGANIALFAKMCIRKLRAALLLRGGIVAVADEYDEDDRAHIKTLSEKEAVTLDLLKQIIDASYDIPKSSVKTLPLEYPLLE